MSGDLHNWRAGDHIGPLVVQRKLGEGWEAVVLLVRDTRDRELRTLKLFKRTNVLPDVRHSVEHWKRYADLGGVKQCLEWGVLPGQRRVSERPWMLMEYVPGVTLADKIKTGRIRDPMALAVRLLETLAPIHERGMGIGDLDKGRNVVVVRGTGELGRFVFIDLDAGTPGHPPPQLWEDLWETARLARACSAKPLPQSLAGPLSSASDAGETLRLLQPWRAKP